METGISPIHGYIPSIEAAIADAPYLKVSEDDAKNFVKKMAILLQANWRNALRQQGLSGPALAACTPTFEHDRMDVAFRY